MSVSINLKECVCERERLIKKETETERKMDKERSLHVDGMYNECWQSAEVRVLSIAKNKKVY